MVGRRDQRQAEQPGHHPPDLVLLGPAVPAHRALDLLGRVGTRRDAALAGRQQHDAAGLADRERGPRIGAEVQLLDRDRIGLVGVEQLCDAGVDRRQPALERDPRRGPDDPVLDRL